MGKSKDTITRFLSLELSN